MTFGQRPDQSEKVSPGDLCERSIPGAGTRKYKGPEAGLWLEYSRNCGEVSVGDSEQGTEAGPRQINSSSDQVMGGPGRVLSRG